MALTPVSTPAEWVISGSTRKDEERNPARNTEASNWKMVVSAAVEWADPASVAVNLVTSLRVETLMRPDVLFLLFFLLFLLLLPFSSSLSSSSSSSSSSSFSSSFFSSSPSAASSF